jgi:adenosylcobinamide kinase/adenosylcobinamide-phosphate guanylyltransferase
VTRTLILGGARSGKSAHAESIALEAGVEVVYLATAGAGDAEMAERILHHRGRRPASWITVEEPLALGAALRRWCAPGRVVLVDCLTLWLTNLMLSDGAQHLDVGEIALPARFEAERSDFLATLDELGSSGGELILVSNEVGMGIVPWGALSRRFADEAGRLNQAVAARCDRALLIVAGLPLVLKEHRC